MNVNLINDAIEHCGSLTAFNLIWSGLLIILAVLVLVIHHNRRRKNNEASIIEFIENNLLTCAGVIFVLGLLLYGRGFWSGNNAGNLIVLIPKVVISALGMFLSGSGLIEIKSNLKDSVFFMTIFTIVHFSAVMITVMMILKVLGYKVESYLKMRFNKAVGDTYVFWNINNNSLMLAESIAARQNATIIFVELPDKEKKSGNFIKGFMASGGISKEFLFRMEKINAYLVSSKGRFVDLKSNLSGMPVAKDMYDSMGLRSLAVFLSEVDESLYFLSDVQNDNVENLMSMVNFFGVANASSLPFTKIYCHARYNSLNSILAIRSETGNSEKIIFADSSKLSVLQLQKDLRALPANYVDIDTSAGVVKSQFDALIIGFGETGRDVFKFIYESSAFLGADGNPSPRKINIMDAKLSDLKSRFLNSAPALKDRNDIVWWDNMSVGSPEFWDRYVDTVEDLDYIVIAINDDKLASELAVKLYNSAYRYRSNMSKFRIFVRLADNEAADMLQLASDYYKEKSNKEDKGTNTLVPFGTYKTLFNIDIFDSEVIDAEADKFEKQYKAISGEIYKEMQSANSPSPTGFAADVKKNTDKQQNISNARHVLTKLILAGAFDNQGNLNAERLEELQKFSYREGVRYVNADPDVPEKLPAYTLMENLSLCEHLRWNAKMELLGFVRRPYDPSKDYCVRDYDLKNHESLVPLHDLNTIEKFRRSKIYDWAVVELSFKYNN